MVDLVLLRHGRTDWNAVHRIQGQSDSQLDDLGHAQAAAVATVVAQLEPAVLWSSDSDRTRDTAAYVAAATGLTPVFDPRLREYSFGALEGHLHTEFAASDPEGYARFRAMDWDHVDGVEKQADVAARMLSVLDDLVAATPEDGVAVAVSHGASIRTGIAALLGWPPALVVSLYGMDNCGYAVLRRRGAGSWSIRAYNRLAPLPI